MKITFLGAAQEVTGSKYLIENNKTRILVDCGLFQGPKKTIMRNWDAFPIEPKSIDAIVLTHAHVDHTGYIPALVKNGFSGPIYCSQGTYALSSILLLDSATLQEEAAKKRSAKRFSRAKKSSHDTTLPPLYTRDDAKYALSFFQVIEYDTMFSIGSLKVTLIRSGHIIGASFVVLSDGTKTITFSGDLSNPDQLIMKTAEPVPPTDFLVVESTYGDRRHEHTDPIKALAETVQKTIARGGALIIPVFAVGRAQTILYCLHQLKQQGIIGDIPIFLDSPMAISVTELFCRFLGEHTIPAAQCNQIFTVARYTRTERESKAIAHTNPPLIIIVGSGMADGGRVADHFERFIADAKNTIAFVGFQAAGTLGRKLINGAESITIHEKEYPVRASIQKMDLFSAHADYNDTLAWLSHFKNPPKKVFLTHGELAAAQALKKKIEERFGWSVIIPHLLESFELHD